MVRIALLRIITIATVLTDLPLNYSLLWIKVGKWESQKANLAQVELKF